MSDLESCFHNEMLNLYRAVRHEVHYDARHLIARVTDVGGLEAARALLRSDRFSDGFVAITLAGRPDLTLEALVLREPWRPLFTDQELAIARRRLGECGIGDDGSDQLASRSLRLRLA